ncbi:extensin-like domain-containing protein [Afifella pfennigii]|uniref:extensin-like domain-containing protein n=1 Tax=Afifella pfennigii TaxID=209897 RepID=UPI00047B43AE|nr:extensin family protein [Afifella pfennigii]
MSGRLAAAALAGALVFSLPAAWAVDLPRPRPEEAGIAKLPTPRPPVPEARQAALASQAEPDAALAPGEAMPGGETEGAPAIPKPRDEAAAPRAPAARGTQGGERRQESAGEVAERQAAFQACRARLTALGAQFDLAQPIDEEGGCFVPHPITLTRPLPQIELRPAARLNCATALALAEWLKEIVLPAAEEHLEGALPTGVRQNSAYVCRKRYGDPEAKLSEHARANAIDISAIVFADRAPLAFRLRDTGSATVRRAEDAIITHALGGPRPQLGRDAPDSDAANSAEPAEGMRSGDEKAGDTTGERQASIDTESAASKDAAQAKAREEQERERLFQREIREGACRYFTTVLGPGVNAEHASHFHFDLAARRGDYRICQ